MKKRTLIILSVIIIVAIIFLVFFIWRGISKDVQRDDALTEKEIITLMDSYMQDLMNNDAASAQEKLYYSSDMPDILYKLDKEGIETEKILHYEIAKSEKLNENIYHFSIMIDNEVNTSYNTVFEPYIVNIDGEWKIILNQRYIPDKLKENLDLTPPPNEIPIEDIIWDETA